ncbi:hypothetical protein LI003_23005, partial [Bacteroides caccae]|uniref:hypothetical protein n=1 Tax=Bacteroides caccae TaxID=47678 RepID=UPI001D069C46
MMANTNGNYAIMKSQPTTFPGTLAYRLYSIVGNVWTLVNSLSKSVSYQASNTEIASNDFNLFASSE